MESSIALLREHQDPGGAWPASPGFAPYQYFWFRGGSFIPEGASAARMHDEADRFHGWCARVLEREKPAVERVIAMLEATIEAISTDKDTVVPRGETCRLIGTRTDGNVFVKRGATLIARGVRVGGGILAENHRKVKVLPRSVDGDVRKSRIDGSIQLKQGGGGKILRAVVGSDIQLFSNDGRFEVRHNRVEGNLQCKSNDPAPVGGDNKVGGNKVGGNKEDQCRNL